VNPTAIGFWLLSLLVFSEEEAPRYLLRIEQPEQGWVRLEMELVVPAGSQRIEWLDRSASGVPWLGQAGPSPSSRAKVLEERFEVAPGGPVEPRVIAPGHFQLDCNGPTTLRHIRRLQIPDRASARQSQHPYASSLSPSGGVLHGRDLFLEVKAPAELRRGSPQLQLDLPEGWTWIAPWGSGASPDQAPNLEALLDNFFLVGAQLHTENYVHDHGQFVVAALQSSLRGFEVDPQSASLDFARAATRALGPLAEGTFLIIWMPLRDTRHQRLLMQRGGTAARSLVAYVDEYPARALAEHPLSVVAHEVSHWWCPKAMAPDGRHLPWFSEGVASYYELLLLARVGLVDFSFVAQALVDSWSLTRGFAVHEQGWSLDQASRRFARDPRVTDFVYRRGSLLAFSLDVALRQAGAEAGLDGVIRALVERARIQGESMRAPWLLEELEAQAGVRVRQQLQFWLMAQTAPDLEHDLQAVGYRIQPASLPYLGIQFSGERSLEIAAARGPARGILRAGDLLRRMDDRELSSLEDFEAAFAELTEEQTVEIEVLRSGERRRCALLVGSRPSPRAVRNEEVTGAQQKLREALLRAPQSSTPAPDEPNDR
jgi:hypothetical protein